MAAGGPLQHVTIFAARPGAAVVVQADYYSRNDSPPANSELPAIEHLPSVKTSPHSNAIALYARTQRNLTETRKISLLDVHA